MEDEGTSTVFEGVPEATTQCHVRKPAADTITLEIIRGKLLALADEMGIVLARTAMSSVIYEVLDWTSPVAFVISRSNWSPKPTA
jgi:hypothetical protein